MRQDLQEIMKMLGARTRTNEGQSDGSQASINEKQRRRNEEAGGRVGGDCQDWQNQWRKRVELDVFEGLNPVNWINRVEKFFKLQGVAEDG